MASITNYFPLDIWREILVRSQPESLIRFRGVSKGFRAVIDDPRFVREHTNNHQQQLSSSNIIFQNRTDYPAARSYYSLDTETLIISCSNGGHQTITAVPLDLTSDGPDIFSSCNGLFLSEKPFRIWNPLTHERLDLPHARDFSIYESSSAFGIGYDSATDDYKSVVILRNRQTHVYSLKSKSDEWRRILNCPASRDGVLRGPIQGPGAFVRGGLNWLSLGNRDVKIVALDLGTEKYSLLQMPPQTRETNNPSDMLLSVLGGCLALCDSGYKTHSDVWVMKDNGDEDDSSWIKVFSIEYEPNISVWSGILRPVAFIMKEKLVFLQDDCERFFMFDVETKSFKCMGIFYEEGCSLFSYWGAKQMFVGTIFRLHANCGGGGRKIATMTTSTNKKASADIELEFCIRDAKYTYYEQNCSICSSKEEDDN